MALQTRTEVERCPKLYRADGLPDYLIAEGTDGTLYKVPSEPGGWMHRDIYFGRIDSLRRMPPETARSSIWFIYGDVGGVTIAEG
jgi:hypothetical protein